MPVEPLVEQVQSNTTANEWQAAGIVGILVLLILKEVFSFINKRGHKPETGHGSIDEITSRWQREVIHAIRDASQAEINHLALLNRRLEENERATKILYDPEEWKLNVERIGELCKVTSRLEAKMDDFIRRRRP